MGKTRFLFFFLLGNTNCVTTFAFPTVNLALNNGKNKGNCRIKTLDKRNIVSVLMTKPFLKNKSLQTNQTYKLHKIINYKVLNVHSV